MQGIPTNQNLPLEAPLATTPIAHLLHRGGQRPGIRALHGEFRGVRFKCRGEALLELDCRDELRLTFQMRCCRRYLVFLQPQNLRAHVRRMNMR